MSKKSVDSDLNELEFIQEKVLKSQQRLFDYYFDIIQSIDDKISHYLSVILITETIIVAYIGVLTKWYYEEVFFFPLVLLLVAAAVFLMLACWLIIATLNPKNIRLPKPVPEKIGNKDEYYITRLADIKEVITVDKKNLDEKAKHLGCVSKLIFWAIAYLLITIVGFLIYSVFYNY